ncbi:glutathione peroxidase [Peteryoungia aggregata LMG 23059]|uniref:Glutathione peroxidase n=1 Tax=Peteryoungia aggregata LMG 23059 TaxID=1368425 RepID=A0ABU0GCV5_9HYPH|nr:glutathione peroxidase [Peteryoungia aggregata]MDQ0423182.1 glutathione peroxidase [Peteryoungia aggregata LMG 23059]
MSVHDFTMSTIDGTAKPLSDYAGKVLLIVNTASACGLTPQYEGLEALYKANPDLVVLGFPCNQFGAQEPGTEKEIALFCETQFAVTFPLFAKIEVNGEGSDPLYAYLKAQTPGAEQGAEIGWNFAKFLVGRNGKPIARYAPRTAPSDIAADIASAIAG